MKITILGKLVNSELSIETQNALNKILNLKKNDLIIDLLFLDENANINSIKLPKKTAIKIYHKITGSNPNEKYIKLIDHYCKTNSFDHLILSLGNLNEDLVPLLGERLNIASFIDCSKLEYSDSKDLSLLKYEYSGNVISHYNLNQSSVFSFRTQKTDTVSIDTSIDVSVLYIDYEIYVEDNVIIREYTKSNSTNLEDADFVIVCGYGVGSKQNVEEIVKYGKKIGATVCGTKKIIDSGWLPMNLLIGQTGHIISPNLCITIGVSGAAPLLNGILGSKKIIAINNDKDARIFSYADYGIVGDYKKIIAKGLISHESN
jgi:electron transfer flavoprotein alpha subunit